MFGFRLADIVGGAAAELNTRFKEDLRRTDERAENTAKERRALRDADKKKNEEFDNAMTSFVKQIQTTLGSGATAQDAVRVVRAYGGDLAGAERASVALTESSDAGIDVSALVKQIPGSVVSGADLPDLIAAMRPASSTRALEKGEVMGVGIAKGIDLGEQINKQVTLPDAPKQFDIGRAKIDKSGLLAAQEYSLDKKLKEARLVDLQKPDAETTLKSPTQMITRGDELMLANANDQTSEGYIKGKKLRDQGIASLKEIKAAEPDKVMDEGTARLLINDVGKTFYATAFEPGVTSDSIIGTLKGYADFTKYFSFAPAMLKRMDAQVLEFNNDPVMKAVVNTEKSKYLGIVSTYLSNFTRADPSAAAAGTAYPVNKGVATFDADGLPETYNTPVPIDKATEDAKRGVYRVGDIMNLVTPSGNQLLAVWTGSEWDN
jgi:hypothetical protein